MANVFLSYSTTDYFFAELLLLNLEKKGVKVWQDHRQLRAGSEWRQGIESGIRNSDVVIVALSSSSTKSSYVTFEWAYALGREKVIIPLKLDSCEVHPRLEPIQYLDFSNQGSLPWETLIQRIKEVGDDATLKSEVRPTPDPGSLDNARVKEVLAYLNQRGYQMITYARLKDLLDSKMTDAEIDSFIEKNKTIFSRATLKGNRPGIKKLIP